MKLKEYLAKNDVKLFVNSKSKRKRKPTQTNNLGHFDYAENLVNVLGKHVWICDYRIDRNAIWKPIREIKPTEVVVASTDTCKKPILHSPICFETPSSFIAPFDDTGFLSLTGVSVNIFETKEECVNCYREQVRQANEIYEKEKARIIKEIDAHMQALNDSLTPYASIPQGKSMVGVWSQVTNNELGYEAPDRDYRYVVSESMIPEKYAIEKLKTRVLLELADKLRANTNWKRGTPIDVTVFWDVYVDGMQDETQTKMENIQLTLAP